LVVCTSCYAFVFEIFVGEVFNNTVARVPILITLLLFPAVAAAANSLAKHLLARAGVWVIPVVVVGNRQQVADAELALKSDRSLGYLIVGSIDPATAMPTMAAQCLRTVLDVYRADCLLIASGGAEMPHRKVIERALQERIPFAVLVQPYPTPTFAFRPTCIFSHDTMLLFFQNGLYQPIPRIAKSAMDIIIALSLLLVVAPALLAISAVILHDGGPILFRQRRVGVGGKPFHCLKFRTMVVDADRVLEEALAKDPDLAAEWATRRKLANDPRITRCGRFLRRASLDELPQLINVLRRDMSLVGPRPIVEGEIPLYGENIAQYYATRPGLTGLWQVTGRSNTSYDRRVQLDVWYVNNWSIWHDITVLLKTVPAVFGREGAC
jgi:undecaprenyl-phosphate galactose phosphotransferase